MGLESEKQNTRKACATNSGVLSALPVPTRQRITKRDKDHDKAKTAKPMSISITGKDADDEEDLFTFSVSKRAKPIIDPLSIDISSYEPSSQTATMLSEVSTNNDIHGVSSFVPLNAKLTDIQVPCVDDSTLLSRLIEHETKESLTAASSVDSASVVSSKVLQKPGIVARAKNNILSLAYNVVKNEKQLNELHASNRSTKQETGSKYGF